MTTIPARVFKYGPHEHPNRPDPSAHPFPEPPEGTPALPEHRELPVPLEFQRAGARPVDKAEPNPFRAPKQPKRAATSTVVREGGSEIIPAAASTSTSSAQNVIIPLEPAEDIEVTSGPPADDPALSQIVSISSDDQILSPTAQEQVDSVLAKPPPARGTKRKQSDIDAGKYKVKCPWRNIVGCPETFLRLKPDAEEHVNVVHRGLVHKCNRCTKAYKHERDLKSHVSRIHEGKKRYQCKLKLADGSDCTWQTDIYDHRQHHDHIHHGGPPVKCTKCGKEFHSTKVLKRHVLTCGLTEKNFKCKTCNHWFKLESNLEEHIRNQHNPDSDPRWMCEKCSKQLSSKASLERHLKRSHVSILHASTLTGPVFVAYARRRSLRIR